MEIPFCLAGKRPEKQKGMAAHDSALLSIDQ
jgi:hypothetical protein